MRTDEGPDEPDGPGSRSTPRMGRSSRYAERRTDDGVVLDQGAPGHRPGVPTMVRSTACRAATRSVTTEVYALPRRRPGDRRGRVRRRARPVRQRQVDAAQHHRRPRHAHGGTGGRGRPGDHRLEPERAVRASGARSSRSSSRPSTCSPPSPRSRTCSAAPRSPARRRRPASGRSRCSTRWGCRERLHHYPSELSGGEQQRVAIARALATGNPLLVADEPTGDLDFRTGVQILQLLREQAEAGRTVIVVTHNREISRVADRVDRAVERPDRQRRAARGRPGRDQRPALVGDGRMGLLFTLRWAARDLRRRWLQVVAIALIIAIGTGVYAGARQHRRRGAGSRTTQSFALLAHVRPAGDGRRGGRRRRPGEMLAVLDDAPRPGHRRPRPRSASSPTPRSTRRTADQTILVPGRVVGMDLADGGPTSTACTWPRATGGRSPTDDAGQRRWSLLERNFADFYDLPPERTLRVAGDQRGAHRRHRHGARVLLRDDRGGRVLRRGQLRRAVHLARDRPGPRRPARAGERPRARARPRRRRRRGGQRRSRPPSPTSGTGLGRDRDAAPRTRTPTGCSTTTSRATSSSGTSSPASSSPAPPSARSTWPAGWSRRSAARSASAWRWAGRARRLAVRPLLVGAQIALAGARPRRGHDASWSWPAIRPVYTSMLPLPVWQHRRSSPAMFLRARRIGFVLPLLATAWPVWRAVRVMPVDAITTTHRLGPQRPGAAAAPPALAGQRLPPHAARQRAARPAPHAPHRARHRRGHRHARGRPRHARLVLRHHGPQRGGAARRPPRPGVGRRSTASSSRAARRSRRSRRPTPSGSVEPVLRLGATLSIPGHEPRSR